MPLPRLSLLHRSPVADLLVHRAAPNRLIQDVRTILSHDNFSDDEIASLLNEANLNAAGADNALLALALLARTGLLRSTTHHRSSEEPTAAQPRMLEEAIRNVFQSSDPVTSALLLLYISSYEMMNESTTQQASDARNILFLTQSPALRALLPEDASSHRAVRFFSEHLPSAVPLNLTATQRTAAQLVGAIFSPHLPLQVVFREHLPRIQEFVNRVSNSVNSVDIERQRDRLFIALIAENENALSLAGNRGDSPD
ncbi:MAG: hypothetical protein NTW08_08380 [Gammaproteobacteria bacterium]|nr:hypothetical protein [Gammaproteobacteria bacterium]